MIVSGHQPNFIPYPGFFHKMQRCDIFVLGDELQFVSKEWQNRNRILYRNQVEFLTVPIKRHFPMAIKDVYLADPFWFEKPLRKLTIDYPQNQIVGELGEIFYQYRERLVDLNVVLIEWVRKKLKIKTKIIYLSDLSITGKISASERIIQILKALKATTYLSGPGGRLYLDLELFKKNGIEVVWDEWRGQTERDYLSIMQRFLDGKFYI